MHIYLVAWVKVTSFSVDESLISVTKNGGEKDSPTEQEVQDCIKSSYSGIDSNENTPTESTDEDENGVNEDGSTDEGEDSEE